MEQSVFWTGFCVLLGFMFVHLIADICTRIRERRDRELWNKTLKLWCRALEGVVAIGGPASTSQAIRGIRELTGNSRSFRSSTDPVEF